MRRSGDRSAEIALGIAMAAMLAVWSLAPTPVGAWKRLIGAVDPNGTSTMRFEGKPVRLLSITGNPWGTQNWEERVSAYHVLALFPTPAVGDEWENVVAYRHYDPLTHSVTLGERRYWLRKGNLFVVRFGEGGEPRVTQLRATFREEPNDPSEVEAAFLHATRGDPEVQWALRDLHNYPSTPKRKCGRRALDPTRSL